MAFYFKTLHQWAKYRYGIYRKDYLMRQKTIQTIKEIIDAGNIDQVFLDRLKNDQRKGVQKLLQTYEKRLQKQELLEEQYEEITSIERQLYTNGLTNIVGIDEAGRGPLAGPVVAAAVVLPKDFKLLGLTDSKQLNEHERNKFYKVIKKEAICYSIALVDNEDIDRINILNATKKAMRSALSQLTVPIDHVLIDAVNIDPLPYTSDVIIKGDQKSISIAAASILAKVKRDKVMREIHREYPMYQFNNHKGYGTNFHLESLKKYGISPYHRKSFAPVQKVMK